MIKFFRYIKHQLLSQYNYNGKSIILILTLLASSSIASQNIIPPPPCYANGNSGFGGAVGEGHILFYGDGVNPVSFGMYTGSNEINDILVLYIDNGAPGRNIIDDTVDDSADDHRIAITNSDVNANGSNISFPPGFEASYAIALDVNLGGNLYSIPSTGDVDAGELVFITSVNSTLISNTQAHYQLNFNWEDIGLTVTDEFHFVGLYVSNTACNSDEGYGDGLVVGGDCKDDIIFSGYITLPGCNETLSETVNSYHAIDAYYFSNQLFIEGINEGATISVYDIQGRKIYKEHYQIQESVPIPLELNKNVLQFIVIESTNKKKVLKVIPN